MSLRLTWIMLAAMTCCSVMQGCAPFRGGSKAVPTGASNTRAASPEQLDGLLPEAPARTAQKPTKSIFGGDNAKKDAAKQAEIDSELAMARLGERRGQSDGAKQLYRKIIEKHPQHPAAYHRLAVLYARDNNFGESNRYFEHAMQMGEPSIDLLSDYGYCLYLQSRHEEAERVLRQALRQKPNHEASCNNLGLVLGAQGRYADSLEAFQRVNNEAEAHANLAYIFSQTGELENARKGYLQALTLNKQLKPAAVAVIQVEKRLQMQEQERARIAQQQATEAAAANAQPAAPVVQAPAPVVEAPVRRAAPQVAVQKPAQSPAPVTIDAEDEIVELPPIRMATRPAPVERSAPQSITAPPKPAVSAASPHKDEAAVTESPRPTVKAPSIAQPTLPRANIVAAKPAPLAMEAAEEMREPAAVASVDASASRKVTAPTIVAQPTTPVVKPTIIPAAEPIAKPIAKPASETADQKSDFVLRPAMPAAEVSSTPIKPELVSQQPATAASTPVAKPSSDFAPAVTGEATAPAPLTSVASKPNLPATPKLVPARDVASTEPPAAFASEKKTEPAAKASEIPSQPRLLASSNESVLSKPTAPRAIANTSDKPQQVVMTPRVIEPVKQPEMITNPTIKKDAPASPNKQLTSLGQSITQGAPVTARTAATPARATTIIKSPAPNKPTPITVEPATESASPQLAPIVSSEQFSARHGSANSPPQHSVRTALTPLDDDGPSQSNGLGGFVTTKSDAKGKSLPPVMSPEEHRQRALRR